jgi:hypothetical protein
MQIGTQTKKNMLSLEVNYHPILMQIGTQTKKNMLSLEVAIPEVTIKFQDGRRRHIGN